MTLARLFLLLLFFPGFPAAWAQQSFELKDLKENPVVLKETFSGKARVYIFLSPECPLCQSYSLTLRNLYDQYHQKGIEMIGIIPGADFTTAQIIEYRIKYKIPFTLLKDEKFLIVRKYKGTTTPEVVVVNGAGMLMYQGRIDNWAYELGKKRNVITEHDLQNVLELIATNKPVKVTRTKPVGCFIE
jgi:peroxiredoxin